MSPKRQGYGYCISRPFKVNKGHSTVMQFIVRHTQIINVASQGVVYGEINMSLDGH